MRCWHGRAQRRALRYQPEVIDWGHVGTLGHYANLLRQITDVAFNEGEHAE